METLQKYSVKHSDMFIQVKVLRSHKAGFKALNKDIKDYLKVKDTENLTRSKLAWVLFKKRTEKLNLLKQAQIDFPTVNWLEFY